jgi:hypothetical protein
MRDALLHAQVDGAGIVGGVFDRFSPPGAARRAGPSLSPRGRAVS